ncbi:hypothetical protein C0991_001181 [Blastosporella zonata]|nr:hypothetical protein C0991_001181 [Blastosporella zonata]
MADHRPTLPSSNNSYRSDYDDPFADRPRPQFQEPERPYRQPSPFSTGSTAHLEAHESVYDDDEIEKEPLTSGQSFGGGFYPPAPLDPNTLGDPYADGRPLSVASNVTGGAEGAWRRRQTIKRGVTRKVKLTNGNFIAEYPVPTPVHSAIEAKWSSTNTTEFSHMRYTAATCDPDDFTEANGWSLRTKKYNRETELLIAVTS